MVTLCTRDLSMRLPQKSSSTSWITCKLRKWGAETGQDELVVESFAWFRKYKAEAIKQSMIKEVREEAGLGSPPSKIHNKFQ